MNTITFDLLTQKLKNTPQDVLDRVSGYVDALTVTASKPYSLSDAQQNILDNQLFSDKKNYVNSEKLYSDLKIKYELLG
jgi:hypothetical protein